ncbi:hypothetical protein IEQ34_006089 [Dendrobium chrysotoxum]|uniref:60S ribosomal export protein NMD3 SH3 domain-containing protein n=1 Tax=Dendrobium chrysotoxum TaxID=161865 RepID=A0AAV7HAR5_DENCH|nr:hypothetical protein IEQ34_006089 [Dendrobium chrysotoxum]
MLPLFTTGSAIAAFNYRAPRSRELLTFFLRHLKPLTHHICIIIAEFMWIEPHSKRIKLLLYVQREALNGAILEKFHLIEFTQYDNLYESCSRFNPILTSGLSQFSYVSMFSIITPSSIWSNSFFIMVATTQTLRIKEADRDKQLVSHDSKSNTYNFKHTFSVEIYPICREDLICLPPKVVSTLCNLGLVMLCIKVSNSIVLLDPFTLRYA